MGALNHALIVEDLKVLPDGDLRSPKLARQFCNQYATFPVESLQNRSSPFFV